MSASARQPNLNLHRPSGRASKLTIGGGVYVLVTLFLAIGAINSQNNLLFWLFGVAIATLIVSGVFSGNALMQIRLTAQAIPDSYAGDSLRLHYILSNQSRFFPLLAAMITEIPEKNQREADYQSAAVIHLGPLGNCKVVGSFVPKIRGQYVFNEVRLTTRFPFGLLQKTLIFECPRTMMALPHQLAIQPGLVRVMQGHGEEVRRQTDSSGSSTEYWGLREYSPGDPKRSIAWKQSARNHKLVVIEHAQPIATRLWVWIDRPADLGKTGVDDPGHRTSELIAFERAIALGASLITQAFARGVPVGLWVPSSGIRMMPGNGKAHMVRCLRSLGSIDVGLLNARVSPPPSGNADDVLVIRSGSVGLASVSLSARTLNVDEPERWMVDSHELPSALGGLAG